MESKLVAFVAMCFLLCLPAASAQNNPPSKEIEISPRKLLLLAAAHGGATEHWRMSLSPSPSPSPSLGDSFVPRLLLVTLASLCVIVAGVLCRRRGQSPQIQSADLAGAETVRPNITYNFIGSCFSVN